MPIGLRSSYYSAVTAVARPPTAPVSAGRRTVCRSAWLAWTRRIRRAVPVGLTVVLGVRGRSKSYQAQRESSGKGDSSKHIHYITPFPEVNATVSTRKRRPGMLFKSPFGKTGRSQLTVYRWRRRHLACPTRGPQIVPRAQQSVRSSRKVDNLTLNSSLRSTEGSALISWLAIIRKRPKRRASP